mmetsp:Transcript_17311/g.50492  ORF Transcript_17311/g.50492 Transcript_17311/m.50492 type:complete len:136 (+) Transcript_17311:1379-1786(+)
MTKRLRRAPASPILVVATVVTHKEKPHPGATHIKFNKLHTPKQHRLTPPFLAVLHHPPLCFGLHRHALTRDLFTAQLHTGKGKGRPLRTPKQRRANVAAAATSVCALIFPLPRLLSRTVRTFHPHRRRHANDARC